MSLTIDKKKLKFSVFGNGFEDDRANSGSGEPAPDEILNFRIFHASFDNTGAYCWLVIQNVGLVKYETETWTDVGQSAIPTNPNVQTVLMHPTNIENNLGVAVLGNTTAYVFDLTDDTIVATIPFTSYALWGDTYDCIKVGDKIHFIRLTKGNTNNNPLITLDLTNLTCSFVNLSGSSTNGFISDSLLYKVYTAEWFYQTSVAYGTQLDGTNAWSTTGINRNDDVARFGFGTNGRLILPVRVYGAWRFGIFNGTSAPILVPPKPARTFGRFENAPDPYYGYNYPWGLAYADGRDELCVMTSEGLLYTDLNEIIKLETEFRNPLSVRNRKVICTDNSHSKGYIYGY